MVYEPRETLRLEHRTADQYESWRLGRPLHLVMVIRSILCQNARWYVIPSVMFEAKDQLRSFAQNLMDPRFADDILHLISRPDFLFQRSSLQLPVCIVERRTEGDECWIVGLSSDRLLLWDSIILCV